jgi:hypothetical protein
MRSSRARIRIADRRDCLLQLGPHLVERPWRHGQQQLFAKAVAAVLRVGADHHAADVFDHELQPAVEEVRAALRLHELARVELAVEPLEVVEDAADERAAAVPQRQREEVTAAPAAQRLFSAEKEAPAALVG